MARKMTTAKVMVSMVFMIIIMCVFTAYSIAIAEESTNIVESYRAGHYISVSTGVKMLPNRTETLRAIDGISYTVERGVINNKQGLDSLTFRVKGKAYNCDHFIYDDGNFVFGDPNVSALHRGNISVFEPNQSIITDNDLAEMKYRFRGLDIMLAGDSVMTSGGVILSEYFVNDLGLDTSIVGENITMTYDNKDYTMQVVGIVRKEFYKLTANDRQHIIVCSDSAFVNANQVKYTTYAYIDNFMQTRIIAEEMLDNKYVNLAVGTEYGISMATTVIIVGNILAGTMITVGLGIIGALLLNIIISSRYMIIKKANFYGMVSAYGMKKQGIFNVLFFEMMYIAMLAAIVAYAVSYGLLYLLDFILSKFVGVGVIFGWANFVITFAVAVVFTLLIVLFVTVIDYSTFMKRNTVKLLNKGI